MGTGRDDFTKDTIRRAAMRVGYHCSYPGCNAVTVGASIKHSDTPVVLGDGAHICAASEGGPRFDSNMTKDERRSIDNVINRRGEMDIFILLRGLLFCYAAR